MAEANIPVPTARPAMSQLAGPILIVLILAMMVLPLPPFVLDLLFTFNISVSLLVVLMAVYVNRPLDFSLFPTVLLLTTLLRLSLNVASTRVVLLYGHTGADAVGTLQHDLSVAQAAQNYTLLTIGDGLVAQLPALIISTAAGVLVTRVSTDQDLNQQFMEQLGGRPQVLYIVAGVLGIMGLVPGM